jgi:deoxyribose-phosphate aldolase
MSISKTIDHTLLKPEATTEQIKKLCLEARENHFASVCVNPSYVWTCAHELKGSHVKVCTVVGFPLGATTSNTKALETKDVLNLGAQEVDMVINIGKLKSGDYKYVEDEIKALADICHQNKAILKVIIETCLLTKEEKIKACELSKNAGADFVKTSTGFSTGGATIEDIELMRKTVGPHIGVKASGGIKDLKTAEAMINAGATRLGTSSGVAIVLGLQSSSQY